MGNTKQACFETMYSPRIADLPADDRPRERLLGHGARVLSNAELVAILLNTGQGPGKLSAVGLAQLLLNELGRDDPLGRLRESTAAELTRIDGIGPAKAATVLAAIELGRRLFLARPPERTRIEDPETAVAVLSGELMWASQERFAVILLDVKHHLLGVEVITQGTATETLSHPRETFRAAVRQGASRILIAHNHPSGSVEPSGADLDLTGRLLQCGQIMEIPLLDHLILGGGSFLSLRQTTALWQHWPQGD